MEKYKISEDLPEKNEYGVYGLDIGTNKVENQITIWIGGGKEHPSNEEEEQANLIVDCLNVFEDVKLKPSELLEQRDELLEALENCVFKMAQQLSLSQIKINKTEFEREIDIAKQAIEKVLKQKQ